MTKLAINTPAELTRMLVAYALQTRDYGHTYVHSAVRQAVNFHFRHEVDGMVFRISSYGRSLQGGGHKYKVHAISIANGKPVPSKVLKSTFATAA